MRLLSRVGADGVVPKEVDRAVGGQAIGSQSVQRTDDLVRFVASRTPSMVGLSWSFACGQQDGTHRLGGKGDSKS